MMTCMRSLSGISGRSGRNQLPTDLHEELEGNEVEDLEGINSQKVGNA